MLDRLPRMAKSPRFRIPGNRKQHRSIRVSGSRELAEDDDVSTPDFLVVPNTSSELPVNQLPNRIKAELRAVYLYFSGNLDPLKGMDPRVKEIIKEWETTRPNERLDGDDAL